jgi:hypothetical protein
MGGIYSGPLEKSTGAQPWWNQYYCPPPEKGRRIHARARLVSVAPGKVFVRWADSRCGSDWKAAAGGAWWVSDNMAQMIVKKTLSLGPNVDTRGVARQYAQVHPTWSNLGTVVVCRTTRPIKVLIGLGRPVDDVPDVTDPMDNSLQVVILTSLASPKNASRPKEEHRVRFIGGEFMHRMWCGNSYAFVDWWQKENIIKKRRQAG